MREDIRRVGRYLLQSSDVDGYVLRIADPDGDPIRGAELLHVNLRDLVSLGEAAAGEMRRRGLPVDPGHPDNRRQDLLDLLNADPDWTHEATTSAGTQGWKHGPTGTVIPVPSGHGRDDLAELCIAERLYADWQARTAGEEA